jgi:hypothetical protein
MGISILRLVFNYFADVIPAFIGIGLIVSFSVLVHYTRKFNVIVVLDGRGHGSALHFCLGITEEHLCDLQGIHCGFYPIIRQ